MDGPRQSENAGPAARRGPLWRRVALLLATLALALGAVEIAARAMTRPASNGMPVLGPVPLLPYRPGAALVRAAWAEAADNTYLVPDAELGWTIRPGGAAFDYAANDQGIRTDPGRRFASARPAGRRRVVLVGDSFTHGDEVPLDDTWGHALEAALGAEVLNFGVPGYGTDQAVLRWRRDARGFEAHDVVLGIWPENVCRNLNRVRYYLQPAGGFLPKPRFVRRDGGLVLLPPPATSGDELAALLAAESMPPALHDERWCDAGDRASRWSDALRTLRAARSAVELARRQRRRAALYDGIDPTGNELTVAIAAAFASEVAATGARPWILLIPMRELLEPYPEDGDLPLVAALRASGLEVVDASGAFTEASARESAQPLYRASGHLTARGNALVAEVLAAALRDGAADPAKSR